MIVGGVLMTVGTESRRRGGTLGLVLSCPVVWVSLWDAQVCPDADEGNVHIRVEWCSGGCGVLKMDMTSLYGRVQRDLT